MENQKLYDLRDEFLRTWSLERVKGMAIEEYTNLNKKDSFCYWLEAITQDLGSIWGGSAFKFGIYKRKDTKRKFEKNALSDGEYAWLAKYGKTKDEAFNKLKSIIVDIIEKSKARNFKAIEPIDLGNATKWKIAHLYSDNHILNVFSKDSLTEIAKELGLEFDKKISFYDLQDLVLKQKSTEEDYFTFAGNLWDLIDSNETHYWLYSPGEQAVMWEEFYDEGIMAIRWDELGDLENYTDRKSILDALIDNYRGGEDQRNNVSAIDDFCNKMNEGDIVIVKKGTKTLLGYGRVTSDYYFDEEREEFLHCRQVKWLKKGEWNLDFTLPRKTLTDVTTYNSDIKGIKYAQYLLNIMNENTQTQENSLTTKLLKYKHQIILQGPPGTGKTREAKRIARELLGLGESDSLEGCEQFKLIQFHPSYSYEDFVRGIVAKPNEEGDGIVYTAENKILGAFAKEAFNNWNKAQQNTQTLKEQDIFEAFIEHIKEELAQSEDYKYPLTDSIYIFNADDKQFKYKGDNWEVHSRGLNMKFSEIKKIIDSNATERKDIIKDYNLEALTRQMSTYFIRIVEKYYEFKESESYKPNITDKIPLKPYVLIIDEINRANLSAVLGELIYALEYRGEAVQSMYAIDDDNTLVLPANLYIIGTMNTADRSVGHIDYAIRRRFAFVDVLPKDLTNELGDNFAEKLYGEVSKLFEGNTLSPEFRKKDVQLGHSYFITEQTPIAIRWEYEIKPILLEYIKDGVLINVEEKIQNIEKIVYENSLA